MLLVEDAATSVRPQVGTMISIPFHGRWPTDRTKKARRRVENNWSDRQERPSDYVRQREEKPNIAPSRSKEKLEGGFLGSVDRHNFGGWIRPSCPCLIRCRQMSCTWQNVDGWLSESAASPDLSRI